jgi:hypothetical protein
MEREREWKEKREWEKGGREVEREKVTWRGNKWCIGRMGRKMEGKWEGREWEGGTRRGEEKEE